MEYCKISLREQLKRRMCYRADILLKSWLTRFVIFAYNNEQ